MSLGNSLSLVNKNLIELIRLIDLYKTKTDTLVYVEASHRPQRMKTLLKRQTLQLLTIQQFGNLSNKGTV